MAIAAPVLWTRNFVDDLSVNDYDLNHNGAAVVGNGVELDGVSGYIKNSTANWRSSDSSGVIMAWIKRSSIGSGDNIFSSCDEATALTYSLQFYVRSTDKLTIRQRSNDSACVISGGTSLAANQWYHVAVVSTGTAWILYVNGVPESLTVVVGSNDGDWFADTDNRDNFTIGAYNASTVNDYFAGNIDDLRVYDYALTEDQIKIEYLRCRRRY